ncbi:hypothetical protein AAE026_29355 [Bradyrhizobium sp. DN5]|uniref:hypothetical protein n=1 Tax=Bradyrhizobium sp. DN5 TaxID=3056950 RepID=UPI0035231CEB
MEHWRSEASLQLLSTEVMADRVVKAARDKGGRPVSRVSVELIISSIALVVEALGGVEARDSQEKGGLPEAGGVMVACSFLKGKSFFKSI